MAVSPRRENGRAGPAVPNPLRPALSGVGPGAPHIDAGEQEQPDHVDEVPVPGRELEAEMVAKGELVEIGAVEADGEEDRADDHMETVEAGRHEEGRAVDVAGEVEGGVRIFIRLAG